MSSLLFAFRMFPGGLENLAAWLHLHPRSVIRIAQGLGARCPEDHLIDIANYWRGDHIVEARARLHWRRKTRLAVEIIGWDPGDVGQLIDRWEMARRETLAAAG